MKETSGVRQPDLMIDLGGSVEESGRGRGIINRARRQISSPETSSNQQAIRQLQSKRQKRPSAKKVDVMALRREAVREGIRRGLIRKVANDSLDERISMDQKRIARDKARAGGRNGNDSDLSGHRVHSGDRGISDRDHSVSGVNHAGSRNSHYVSRGAQNRNIAAGRAGRRNDEAIAHRSGAGATKRR